MHLFLVEIKEREMHQKGMPAIQQKSRKWLTILFLRELALTLLQ